jgi:hypothetical protein
MRSYSLNSALQQITLVLDYAGADAVSTGGGKYAALHHFQTNSKGFGNINLSVDEAGDIFCGWSNDGTMRYPEAEWLVAH